MRDIVLLLIVIAAFFAISRWHNQPSQEARQPEPAPAAVADTRPGGVLRDIENQPNDVMEMQGAVGQPAGVSSAAMMDAARAAQR